MKKLLVLTLVLGIASLASAGTEIVPGLEYTVSGTQSTGGTITLTGTAVKGFLINLQPNVSGKLSNGDVAAGFTTVNVDGVAYNGNWAGASASNTTGITGTVFTVDFASGMATATFYNESAVGNTVVNFESAVSLTGEVINIPTVPEPATMALLGLGGLFLARRKK